VGQWEQPLSPQCKSVNRLYRPERNEGGVSSPLFTEHGAFDSVLFGHSERKLSRYHAENLSEFLIRIRVTLSEISRPTLNAAFLDCMERLQTFIETNVSRKWHIIDGQFAFNNQFCTEQRILHVRLIVL
jgi:hypothetical protein